MTGFDSEADRRDAIRKQIVNNCVAQVYLIVESGPTGTPEERRYLEQEVALQLLRSQQLEAMSMMMRREIADAEKEIDAAS